MPLVPVPIGKRPDWLMLLTILTVSFLINTATMSVGTVQYLIFLSFFSSFFFTRYRYR